MVRFENLYAIKQRAINCEEVVDKGEGIWASRSCKLWEGKYRGKLIEHKGYFSNVCYTDSRVLSLVIKAICGD